MATRTAPSFSGLTIQGDKPPEDDSWKDPAFEPEGARFHEGQTAPLGLLNQLPAAPFEQNINIGGPTYSAVPPQRSELTIDEQNVTVPTNPFGWMGQAFSPGAYAPMPASWMEDIQKSKEHELTPGSWMHRAGTKEWQGGWDVLDAGLDIADIGVPGPGLTSEIGKMAMKGLASVPWGDIARVIPEGTASMLAGIMPQKARNLLKGSKVVDAEGTPTRVYHGTQGVFDKFTPEFQDSGAMLGRGYYFTENPTISGGYAETKGWRNPETGIYEGAPNVHANYLNLQKPLDMEGGAQNDVITKMSDKIFSFAKGAPTDAERAADLEGLSNNLFNLGGNYGDPDDFLLDLRLDIDVYDIDKFIANRQWDEAEKGLLEWFKKASNSNQDVFNITNDFFRYRQDPTKQSYLFITVAMEHSGKDVWTDGLQELGYDGMTHIGKGSRGQGGAQHRVWIVFDEKHIFPSYDLEGMNIPPEALPPSGDFSKMLKDIFGKGMGR